jgi:hypothetical protein
MSIFKNFLKTFHLLIILASLSSCSSPSIISTWNNEIKIDGNRLDWVDKLKYFEDERVALGVMNDNEYVYLCFVTSDRAKAAKILRTGFTIWLDPLSSDGKTIGIQYPIKTEKSPDIDMLPQSRSHQQNKSDKSQREQNLVKMLEKMKSEQHEILVVNEDKFPLYVFPVKSKNGLEVSINFEGQQLVYELKVPLANNNLGNFVIDALPNEDIRFGFESGKFQKPEGDQGMQRGGANKMQGGSRGVMSRGNRPNMRNMQDMMDPINFWVNVKLGIK